MTTQRKHVSAAEAQVTHSEQRCPFCEMPNAILENDLAVVLRDIYPVSQGHMLVATRRHVSSYFETTPEERRALEDMLLEAKKFADSTYKPDGYNVGINVGEAAGQTVFHVHIHLIPRYSGDVPRARGGVRGVIPSKQHY